MTKIIREYKDSILSLRGGGNLEEALERCDEAIQRCASEWFFYKIIGDILAQKNLYKEASSEYLNFLIRIPDVKLLFSDFAARYNRLKRSFKPEELK